ncbi:MAG: hypothetical protein JSR96_05425 [Proteobacteria bacterium]|nr:hypothetical protein [Pseudomonadota bacterium]
MTDASIKAWEAELKTLLEVIRTHPSADLEDQRQRVIVLQKLIGDHHCAGV